MPDGFQHAAVDMNAISGRAEPVLGDTLSALLNSELTDDPGGVSCREIPEALKLPLKRDSARKTPLADTIAVRHA
jgi:hypothetical protein